MAGSFVTFAEKLSQLRDPERLRPWLYAIVLSECPRRLKARKRVSYGDDEQLAAVPDESATPEEAAEKAALTKLVWDAVAGLADRDRALLHLHLPQGLEGAELGEAMGTTAANAYVMLNRLRAQVDRSLGALLIARLGRQDCDDLDTLLTDWDGSFSPLIRKRVARHVEGCEICGERRKRILSPWMLLAGVPVFVAPLTLRDRVLNDTQLVSASGPPPSGPRWGRRATGTAAAAALVVAASLTTVAVWPDGDTEPADDVVSTPTAAEPGEITVSTAAIDLGRSRTSAVVPVADSAGPAIPFTAADDRSWLSVTPSAGTLAGDGLTRITVRAQRSRLDEGTSRGTVRLVWTGGSATIRVSIRQENVPVGGRHRFTVTATDTRGNPTTGPTLTTDLDPCPG